MLFTNQKSNTETEIFFLLNLYSLLDGICSLNVIVCLEKPQNPKTQTEFLFFSLSIPYIRAKPGLCGSGGERKLAAIRGAILGGFINVLITDSSTAEGLLKEEKV